MKINTIYFLSFIHWKLVSIVVYILELINILPKMDVDNNIVDVDDDETVEMEIQKEIYTFEPYKISKIDAKIEYPQQVCGLAPRSGHRIVCTETNLYSFGGFNPDYQHRRNVRHRRRIGCLFQELWKFNLMTNKWNLCMGPLSEGMPKELASNAMIVEGNTIIIFGGTGYPFGETCSNNCYIYHVDSLPPTITQLEVYGDLPTPVYGPTIVVHDNNLYTIGGTTGYDYSCDIYRLNLVTKRWECVYICKPDIQDDPPGRYRHEIVYDGKLVYIMGGGMSEEVFDLKTLAAFDLDCFKWKYITTKPDPTWKENGGYPEARRCHSCIQYKTDNGLEAVIAGGCARNSYFADIWKIDFNTFQWRLFQTTQLPIPIYFHDAATPGNGCMYVFGGIEYQTRFARTRDLYKMWVTIPKLSEICWDAISYYNPNLNKYSKVHLLQLGIPNAFVKRLEFEVDK